MKKKFIGFAVALSVITLLSGCGGGKKSSGPIIINVKTPTLSFAQNKVVNIKDTYAMLQMVAEDFEKQHAKDNVKIKLVKFPYKDEDAFITKTFDTPDATDVLMEGYFNMNSYIHTGRVVPLDDVLTAEQKADLDAGAMQQSTINGKLYMLPYFGHHNVLAINKNLFRQAGLDKYVVDDIYKVQSWTEAEWTEVLDTLAAKKPNGAFPYPMYAKNEQGDTHTMVLLRSRGCKFFDDKGNFNLNTPEGIATLKWLQDANKKGYFPAGCENLQIGDSVQLGYSGKLALFIFNNSYNGKIKIEDLSFVNFPGNNGKGLSSAFISGFEVFDNKNPEKLKWSKEFVKFIYNSDKYMDYSMGAIPYSKKVIARHQEKLPEIKRFTDNQATLVDFTANNPNWRGVRNVFWKPINALMDGRLTPAQAAAKIDADCNAAIAEGRKNSKLHE
ncbi:MAG: extracellular solute-binding protein [Phascolarctobacterium sp.]|nr:extracellular solute-binding protein [Phascolarctobacterium sp.]